MESGVPPPPRPVVELNSESACKVGEPAEQSSGYEVLVTKEDASAVAAPSEAEPAEEGPFVPKATSQDDIVMYGRKVHVHGEMAKKAAHPPQHAPQGLNYAAVAREEIHDVAVHPPPVKLMGGETGVEAWDKAREVNSPKVARSPRPN